MISKTRRESTHTAAKTASLRIASRTGVVEPAIIRKRRRKARSSDCSKKEKTKPHAYQLTGSLIRVTGAERHVKLRRKLKTSDRLRRKFRQNPQTPLEDSLRLASHYSADT